MGPQLAVALAAWVVIQWAGKRLTPEMAQSLESLSLLFRILWAGPYGIELTLKAKHCGFHLQAFGLKH